MNPTPKPATIADVAARAGVSVPTVSRVLTGAARVTPEKRERVDQAIAELSFRPAQPPGHSRHARRRSSP